MLKGLTAGLKPNPDTRVGDEPVERRPGRARAAARSAVRGMLMLDIIALRLQRSRRESQIV